MSEKKEFGNRLRSLRKKKNLSIEKVSEIIDVAPSTYREWEQGRSIRGEQTYFLLASLFEVSVYHLLTGESFDSNDFLTRLEEIEQKIQRVRMDLKEFFHSNN